MQLSKSSQGVVPFSYSWSALYLYQTCFGCGKRGWQVAEYQAEVVKLTVSDPFDNADITPVIDNASAESWLKTLKKKGAKRSTQSSSRE